ncbi:HI_0552 family protein [Enterococcus faecalis]|uniref:HI_0552 family protein n=1 Tax=Enterococcus faecalis TaxID=1351 RepID=UPI000CF2C034|nr:HI_0552 family protein [Enterococcus faecalis]PQD16690.1 hypothetical protein CUN01_02685 [Enterococcus faecalis]PQD80582.1 hypothetical protein CUM71_14475 [Enterococcus faecalis]
MNLTHQDFNLFNREIFTFKQLKEQQTSAEIDDLKQTYKQHWEKWKALNLAIAQGLPAELGITKPKIESWTNGWNLRSHFWAAYRSEQRQAENACLALLLNKKQFQVYLMFQHYKSEERTGNRSFQIGKLWFATEKLETIEEKSCQALQELAPLYNALSEK